MLQKTIATQRNMLFLCLKEFLSKGMSFWFGGDSNTQQDTPMQRDDLIEIICAKGCHYVYEAIRLHQKGTIINELEMIPEAEQKQIIKELADIMQVYEH